MNIHQLNLHAKRISLVSHGATNQKYKFFPKYFKKITKIEEGVYKLELSIEILNTKENPFPLDIIADFETTFKFTEIDSEDNIMEFLNIGAIQMVFPFMRSAVNNVVTSSLLSPLVIPVINVRNFEFRD